MKFFKTRAAEMAANIILAELEPFRGLVFTRLDYNCAGEVIATTRQGAILTLAWDVAGQYIRTVDVYERVMTVELAA